MAFIESVQSESQKAAEASKEWRIFMDIDATYGGHREDHMAMSYDTVEADAALPVEDPFEAYAAALEANGAHVANTTAAKIIEAATGYDIAA